MECKQQSLLLLKSATALNSVVILAILCTIVYQHQQLIDLKGQIQISQDSVSRFTPHNLKLLSLLSLEENYRQQQQETPRNSPTNERSKGSDAVPVYGERQTRKRTLRSINGKAAASDDQRISNRVNMTNATTSCSRCQQELLEKTKNPKGSKVN